MTSISLGTGITPWARGVAEWLAKDYPGILSISGWRATAGDMEGHPAGLALDIVTGDSPAGLALGTKIRDRLDQYGAGLQVKYTIWQQMYKQPGKAAWRMDTRPGEAPGYDPNHKRHVHVSFLPAVKDGRTFAVLKVGDHTDGGSPVGNAVGDVIDSTPVGAAVDTAKNIGEALTDRNTWMRVGKVVGGAALIYFGALVLMRDNLAAAVGAASDVIPQAKVAKTAVKATAAATSPSTS